MNDSRSPKGEWVGQLPVGPPMKDDLAAMVSADEARDAAEVGYYESAADPVFVQVETKQRRFRAQSRRRLRHRQAKRRSRTDDE